MEGKVKLRLYTKTKMTLVVLLCILTVVSSQISTIQALMITSHAIVSELDKNNLPIGFKTSFKRGDPKAISWVKMITLNGTYKCNWKWMDPDKKVFTETSKEISGTKVSEITYSELVLEEAIFGKPGAWSVQFYINDEYQFTDVFTIVSDQGPKPTTPPPAAKEANLTITQIIRSPAEGEVIYPRDNITITCVLENLGDVLAKNAVVTVETTPAGLDIVRQATPKDIAKAERTEFTLEFRASTAGVFELTCQAVADEKILDTKKISVEVLMPNVDITSVGEQAIPEKGVAIKPGDYITYIVSLKNIGTTPARTVELKPLNVPDGIRIVESTPTTGIQAGEAKNFTLRFFCEKEGYYKFPINLIIMGKTIEAYRYIEVTVSTPVTISWPIIAVPVLIVALIGLGVFFKKRGLPRIGLPKVSREPRMPPPEKALEVEAVTRYCGSCGAPVDESTKFCGKCGKPT